MRENIAKKRLYAGETLYGIFANAISPELIEIMGITGFDFIVVDRDKPYLKYGGRVPRGEHVYTYSKQTGFHRFKTL